jgi:hypothetical protein
MATLGTWQCTSYCSVLGALASKKMKHAARQKKLLIKFVLLMCLFAVTFVACKFLP